MADIEVEEKCLYFEFENTWTSRLNDYEISIMLKKFGDISVIEKHPIDHQLTLAIITFKEWSSTMERNYLSFMAEGHPVMVHSETFIDTWNVFLMNAKELPCECSTIEYDKLIQVCPEGRNCVHNICPNCYEKILLASHYCCPLCRRASKQHGLW